MYPNLYYAFKDLFGIELSGLKMIQSFGFFVALGFLLFSYLLGKEFNRKEKEGVLSTTSTKILKGAKASLLDYFIAGVTGLAIGYKLGFIIQNFSTFVENTQAYILSTEGSIAGALIGAGISIFMRYRESEQTKLPKPELVEEIVHPEELVGNITLIAAFGGIIGAKIFHNLENWDEFIRAPLDALLSFSGLTVYGGLIVAAIAIMYYCKHKGLPILHIFDAAAPVLMIGYAVGRMGCQVAGDGDWGIVNTLQKPNWLSFLPDWAWAYDYPNNVNSVGTLIPNCDWGRYCYHLPEAVFPTPLYEITISILMFLILWSLRTRIKAPGVLFSIYLIFNGTERFFIEKIRVNTLYNVNGFEFTQAELISSLFILLGVFGYFYFSNKHKQALS